jgi:hypothetical protein
MSDEHGGIAEELIPEVEEAPTGLLSIRDQIRAERDELKTETKLDLVVPGYEMIGVRYRGIPSRELDAFAKSLSKSKEGMRTAADVLIRCCESILVRPHGDDALEPLEDDQGDCLKFDQRLADFLGIEAATAREIVIQLFSPDGVQTLAAFEHANAVMEWMQGKGSQIDPSLLGE